MSKARQQFRNNQIFLFDLVQHGTNEIRDVEEDIKSAFSVSLMTSIIVYLWWGQRDTWLMDFDYLARSRGSSDQIPVKRPTLPKSGHAGLLAIWLYGVYHIPVSVCRWRQLVRTVVSWELYKSVGAAARTGIDYQVLLPWAVRNWEWGEHLRILGLDYFVMTLMHCGYSRACSCLGMAHSCRVTCICTSEHRYMIFGFPPVHWSRSRLQGTVLIELSLRYKYSFVHTCNPVRTRPWWASWW